MNGLTDELKHPRNDLSLTVSSPIYDSFSVRFSLSMADTEDTTIAFRDLGDRHAAHGVLR